MKYLKYFESHIRQGPGQLPLQKINLEEFKKLLQENCKQFLEIAQNINFTKYSEWSGSKQLLFRKFNSNHGDFVFTHPKVSEHRRIAPWSDWGNWHNLIISNLDSWKEYPRRNKSMIASGWSRAKSHMGTDMYLVIPFDRTKIGVCESEDFWNSFNVYRQNRLYIPQWFKNIIQNLSSQSGVTFFNDDSWEDILPHLDRKYDNIFYREYDVNKTLLENLNEFLNPKKNQFRLETFSRVSKLQKQKCRECWFEDEALLISWKYLTNLNKEEIQELFPSVGFFSKFKL